MPGPRAGAATTVTVTEATAGHGLRDERLQSDGTEYCSDLTIALTQATAQQDHDDRGPARAARGGRTQVQATVPVSPPARASHRAGPTPSLSHAAGGRGPGPVTRDSESARVLRPG